MHANVIFVRISTPFPVPGGTKCYSLYLFYQAALSQGVPFQSIKKKTCDNLAVKLYHKEKDPSTVLTDLSRTVVCAMSVRPFPHRSVLLGVGFDTVIVIQEIQDLFSARFVQFVKSSHHSLGGKLLGEVIALVQGCEIYRIQ